MYYNVSKLGPLTASLRGECGVAPASPTRVNLEFKDVTLTLGGLQLAKKVRWFVWLCVGRGRRECGAAPASPTRPECYACPHPRPHTDHCMHAHHPFPTPNLSTPTLSHTQEWEAGKMRGHWAATYWDDDFRVFNTNKGSLFVMAKAE